MTYEGIGRVIKGVGGLFTVRMERGGEGLSSAPLDGKYLFARGRGALRQKGSLLVGDRVRVLYDDSSFSCVGEETVPSPDGAGAVIEEILERSCALIRPPMSNLNVLFVTVAAASPDPVFETVDKLISIAEFNGIEPVMVVTKCDLNPEYAGRIEACYKKAGFEVFLEGEDTDGTESGLRHYIETRLDGKIAAFSGASGVGKSTMLNKLFPHLSLETGEISHRIERGKNTTRCVELYPLSEEESCGFLADTPGFTMLDFERFDFFEKEDLPATFREFLPHIGNCKYTKCSHTKEEGCAVLEAVKRGEISRSRHRSFTALYEVLKKKTKW